jgi:hypothetical protein
MQFHEMLPISISIFKKWCLVILSTCCFAKQQLHNPVKINQLPVSAGRWQPMFEVYFATFICRKITKLLITQ